MSSKTLKYLSYSVIIVAILLIAVFNLRAGLKIPIFYFFVPAVAVSYLLKLWALKKANLESRDLDYLEAIEKEIYTAKWALIMILGLGIVDAFYRYS